MQKVVALSQAATDQDHIPILVHIVPQIPDRSACILHGGEDPFPALLEGLKRLEASQSYTVKSRFERYVLWFEIGQ